MSKSEEIAKWNAAYEEYSTHNFDIALQLYDEISYLSKISYNMGSIYFELKDFENAIKYFTKSIDSDPYLLIALFQRGNSYFSMGGLDLALKDYTKILQLLNSDIDYSQLGLNYRLFKVEVLFNRSLCYLGLDWEENSQSDLKVAKTFSLNNLQSKAIDDFGWESRIFTVKEGLQFKVSESKLSNMSEKKYLKNAVSVKESDSSFLGFLGSAAVFPENVFLTSSRGKSVIQKTLPSSPDDMQDQSEVPNDCAPEEPQKELSEIYISIVQGGDSEAILGHFRDKERAESVCKDYIRESLGENSEIGDVHWTDKGWIKGKMRVYVDIRKLL